LRQHFSHLPADEVLMQMAFAARELAYAPFSGFRVGAALVAEVDDGYEVVTGVNIENDSYPAGICAERVAVFSAVTDGLTNIQAVAIASDYADYLAPCGMCRQVIHQFAPTCKVIMTGPDNALMSQSLSVLLPMAFELPEK